MGKNGNGKVGKIAVALTGLLLVSACASSPEDAQLAQSPSYHIGYGDGCRTANARQNGLSSEVTRNESIYKTNRAYRAGWRAGYVSCGGSAGNESSRTFNGDQWQAGARGL